MEYVKGIAVMLAVGLIIIGIGFAGDEVVRVRKTRDLANNLLHIKCLENQQANFKRCVDSKEPLFCSYRADEDYDKCMDSEVE